MSLHVGQRTRYRKAVPSLLVLILGIAVIPPRFLFAHPMGNFSISHFAGIRIEAGWLELHYILDLAEIPTFQEMQATGIVPTPGDARVTAYLARKGEALRSGLLVTLNRQPLLLEIQSEDVIFPPGASNLPTMKIGVVYRAPFSSTACPCTIDYRDSNFPERVGWKEVVTTAAPGLTLLASTAATVSRSQELANYPTDLINSPPQDLSAQLTFAFTSALPSSAEEGGRGGGRGEGTPSSTRVNQPLAPSLSKRGISAARVAAMGVPGCRGGPCGRPRATTRVPPTTTSQSSAVYARLPTPGAVSPQKLRLEANKQGTPRNRFTQLIASNHWGLWFVLTAALIAVALGGLHALEPGHGKTIVAAYLVGSQGTAAHALLLGLLVTVTHTAGVYALALVTLYASKYVVPDHLYPCLGIGSGLTIALLGVYMLRRRYAGRGYAHGDHHHHMPWGRSNGHQHAHPHKHLPHPEHSHEHTNDRPARGHAPALAHAHVNEHHHHDHQGLGYSHGDRSLFSYSQLVTLGVTGGIIPCPAALVVLLSAISLHRVVFGLYLIVAFSLGLAVVLISIGLVTVYARRLLSRLPSDGPLLNRWLPMVSATAITCLGVGIVVQALLAVGLIHLRL